MDNASYQLPLSRSSVHQDERTLGRTGLRVSEIGVGGWAIGGPAWNLGLEMGWREVDEAEAERALDWALHQGITHFDTADVYGLGRSERVLGRALRRHPRDRYVLASKVGYFSGTAENAYHPLNIRNQLEMSLTNLATDYLDLYYMHNFEFGEDDQFLEPAVREFEKLRQAGKIRFVGMRGPHRFASNRNRTGSREDKYRRFYEVAERVSPDVIQLRYNIFTGAAARGRNDIFRWAEDRGLGLVINKPLAQGLLLGKYDPADPPRFGPGDHRNRKSWFQATALAAINARLERLRERFGDSPAELARVALQYCLAASANACVVVGFRDQAQLGETIGATGRPLSAEDIDFIDMAMAGLPEELGDYFAGRAEGGIQAGDTLVTPGSRDGSGSRPARE